MNATYANKWRLLFFTALLATSAFGQIDTLRFANGNEILGVVQSMDRGILAIETDYGDDDFLIEWSAIQYISTGNDFLISLSDGRRLNGTIRSFGDSLLVVQPLAENVLAATDQIVFLGKIEEGFKNRFNASIDLSASFTKANRLRQGGMRSSVGYQAERWAISGDFNNLYSEQRESDRTDRTDASLAYRQLLRKGFFFFPEANYLSNTEQLLDLRFTALLGVGKYLFRTNQLYWFVTTGAANTTERFDDETPDKNSYESFVGTNIHLFDIGDLSLMAKGTVYPSLTESQRIRVDAQIDIKYDLPLDFYIRVGTTYNYDNQPAESGTVDDYVIQTGIGWEW